MRERNRSGPPEIRIRDFDSRRDLLPLAFAGAAIGLAAIAGMWDAVVPAVGLFVILSTNVVRRMEWRGRHLPTLITERSVFREGLRALPKDIVTLAVIAVVLPSGAIAVALISQTVWAWLGVILNCVIAFGALIALAIEIRRRLS